MFFDLTKDNLINTNDNIIIGVSGGPDSMCLLHLLIRLKEQKQLTLFVAHVNHHTRGNENQKEEQMIRDVCLKYKIPFFVEHFIHNGKENFHEASRNFRYAFFKRLAKENGCSKIALAHHEDDQNETILFKIIRGNHLKGYLGMKPIVRIDDLMVIRPFLKYTKASLVDYCVINQVPFAKDSSNLKNKYSRNLIRNKIIPLFREIQPDLNHKMGQFQEQLQEAVDYLEQNAKNIYREMIISHEKDRIILDLNKLKTEHISIIRMILFYALDDVSHKELELTYEKIKNLLQIIKNDHPNVTFDLGKNYFCIKAYETICFQSGLEKTQNYHIEINEFKDYELPNGMKIRVKKVEEKAKINNKKLFLCYNSTIWPLVIRPKLDGDRIKTKIGNKKVNRIFIDAKIPMQLRKTWPILVNHDGEVLWVIGLQKPEFNENLSCDQFILIEVMNEWR